MMIRGLWNRLVSFFRRKSKAEPEVSEDVGQELRRRYQEERAKRPKIDEE